MKRKKAIVLSGFLAASFFLGSAVIAIASETEQFQMEQSKPRVCITNDGEIDDKNSFVHLLYYANEMDLVGLVQTSSFAHWAGSEKAPAEDGKIPYAWPGIEWMDEMIDDYAEIYDNLLVHDPEYPSPDYLHSIVKIGNIGYTGEMDEATEGSEFIKQLIMDDEETPLYLTAWGGMNTIGRALRDIYEEYGSDENWEAIRQKIYDKVRIYTWSGQDKVRGSEGTDPVWDEICLKYYPDMIYVDVKDCQAMGWSWENASTNNNNIKGYTHPVPEVYTGEWMMENLESSVNGVSKFGPLMDWYVTYGDGTHVVDETPLFQFGEDDALMQNGIFAGSGRARYDFCGEGDTPTYLSFFNTGLDSLEHVEWGSYAGRLEKDASKAALGYTNYYTMAMDEFTMSDWANVGGETVSASYDSSARWITDIMNAFAARVEWGITPNYEDANHTPSIAIAEGNQITAAPGETIYLNAHVSDPDNDNVYVKWFNYKEAGTLGKDLPLGGDGDGYRTSLTIPADAEPGSTIHILAKATDDGDHNLSYYQRIIITVA